MRCYEAVPETTNGAVVVIQEAFGVNAHIEDVTRRFAAAGYHAVAPDLFHRGGGGTADYGDFETVIKLFGSISGDADVLTDVDAALDHLRSEGFEDAHIGIVGFCFGGRISFLVSLERALGAGVGFYGGGIVTARFPQFPPIVDRTPTLQTPWLGLFGDLDTGISVEDVVTLQKELVHAPVATEVVRYPYAAHAFHTRFRPDHYVETAAKDAWERTLCWLDQHLPARPGRSGG